MRYGSSATASTSRFPTTRLTQLPFISLAPDSPELKYMQDHRAALGGHLPQRRRTSTPLTPPSLTAFDRLLQSSGEREISTTMAFVQMLGTLLRDKGLGKFIVPIVPDESRTFSMEGMFRQLGIYSAVGQLYQAAGRRPADLFPRGQGGAGAAGRHQRGRCHEQLDRRGDLVQHEQRADDPVLHLLLCMFGLSPSGPLAFDPMPGHNGPVSRVELGMHVYPAIDLRDGRCVRLRQGDYARETVFSDDPVSVARRWVELGADRLHLVDLDGAKAGRPLNGPVIRRIAEGGGRSLPSRRRSADRRRLEGGVRLGGAVVRPRHQGQNRL